MSSPIISRPTELTSYDVFDAFRKRGWVKGAGGELYFDGHGKTDHPHLHLRVKQGMHLPGKDIRMNVAMLAYSDGKQGQGGGGKTYILNGELRIKFWRPDAEKMENKALYDEFTYIMGYYTEG